MQAKVLFQAELAQFLTDHGYAENCDPVASVVERAKSEIRYDVTSGTIPKSVKSFSELHDYIDANSYGDAFDWPTLIGDVEDEEYAISHSEFWNEVQNRLHEWIASGEMRASLHGRAL